MVNYIVCKGGQPVMTVGCPGGDTQAQANVQLILNTLVFGMNPQEAIEAPRFSTQSVPSSFYPPTYFPGQLTIEHGIPTETKDTLRGLGHEVVPVEVCGMGATVTRRDPETGVLSGGADPRRAATRLVGRCEEISDDPELRSIQPGRRRGRPDAEQP